MILREFKLNKILPIILFKINKLMKINLDGSKKFKILSKVIKNLKYLTNLSLQKNKILKKYKIN